MADSTPAEQTVPAEAMDAADEAFAKAWMNGADYADALRLAVKSAAPILVAAGRAQAATDILAKADDSEQRTKPGDSHGLMYVRGMRWAAHVAEEAS